MPHHGPLRLPSKELAEFWLYAYAQSDHPPTLRRTGKWLLFGYAHQIDEMWATVKTATETNRLGPLAKVATARPNPDVRDAGTKIICVYTRDTEDQADIARVLKELRGIGFAGRLSYKADDDTLAGTYGSGASLYTSAPGSLDFTTPKARTKRKSSTPPVST